MRWYVTVAAVHEFQGIAGLPAAADGPLFDRAAKELSQACESATLWRDEGHRQIYRAKVQLSGRVVRLELYVSLQQRPEGDLPQLVRVRSKGFNRPRHR